MISAACSYSRGISHVQCYTLVPLKLVSYLMVHYRSYALRWLYNFHRHTLFLRPASFHADVASCLYDGCREGECPKRRGLSSPQKLLHLIRAAGSEDVNYGLLGLFVMFFMVVRSVFIVKHGLFVLIYLESQPGPQVCLLTSRTSSVR
jgi:hypothetical protein